MDCSVRGIFNCNSGFSKLFAVARSSGGGSSSSSSSSGGSEGSVQSAPPAPISGSVSCSATSGTSNCMPSAVQNHSASIAQSSSVPLAASIINMSVRAPIGADDEVAIVGFVVRGGPLRIKILGKGPSLSNFSLTAVSDPLLRVFNAQGQIIFENDNYVGAANDPDGLLAQESRIGSPGNDANAGQLFQEGSYTAHLIDRSATGASTANRGNAIIELYAYPDSSSGKLANISARTLNLGEYSADNVPIVGFVISGTGARRMVVRGSSGILRPYGIPETKLFKSVTLNLFKSSFYSVNSEELKPDVFSHQPLGKGQILFGTAQLSSEAPSLVFPVVNDSANITYGHANQSITLEQGNYTAILRPVPRLVPDPVYPQFFGNERKTGLTLLEVYDVSESSSLSQAPVVAARELPVQITSGQGIPNGFSFSGVQIRSPLFTDSANLNNLTQFQFGTDGVIGTILNSGGACNAIETGPQASPGLLIGDIYNYATTELTSGSILTDETGRTGNQSRFAPRNLSMNSGGCYVSAPIYGSPADILNNDPDHLYIAAKIVTTTGDATTRPVNFVSSSFRGQEAKVYIKKTHSGPWILTTANYADTHFAQDKISDIKIVPKYLPPVDHILPDGRAVRYLKSCEPITVYRTPACGFFGI